MSLIQTNLLCPVQNSWDVCFQVMHVSYSTLHRFLLNICLGEKNLYLFLCRGPDVQPKFSAQPGQLSFPLAHLLAHREHYSHSCDCNIASLGHVSLPALLCPSGLPPTGLSQPYQASVCPEVQGGLSAEAPPEFSEN